MQGAGRGSGGGGRGGGGGGRGGGGMAQEAKDLPKAEKAKAHEVKSDFCKGPKGCATTTKTTTTTKRQMGGRNRRVLNQGGHARTLRHDFEPMYLDPRLKMEERAAQQHASYHNRRGDRQIMDHKAGPAVIMGPLPPPSTTRNTSTLAFPAAGLLGLGMIAYYYKNKRAAFSMNKEIAEQGEEKTSNG